MRKIAIHITLALLLLSGCLGGAYYYLLAYTRSGEAIEVPELSGTDLLEAESMLEHLGLYGNVVDSLYMPGKRGGHVLTQEPISGSHVKAGRKIYLTVTRYSAPMVILPNVMDQSLPLAIAKLKSYGLRIGDLIPRPSECTDCAIGIMQRGQLVQSGAKLMKGSSVDILVGVGSMGAPIGVPSVIGLNRSDAENVLMAYGLYLGAIPCEQCANAQDSATARIFRQQPAAGTAAPIGSGVDIYLTTDPSKIPAQEAIDIDDDSVDKNE